MDIILLEKIHKLGELGDRVSVKPGYGRNFLIPQKKAVFATKANIEKFKARRAELERAEKETMKVAEARAEKLNALVLTLKAPVTEDGKLYGSVGTREIADAVEAAGAEVDKSEILLPEGPLHEVGEFKIAIQLHGDVMAAVAINVVAEGTETS